jgi:ribosomal protein S12 methylthiotransferase accessory factor
MSLFDAALQIMNGEAVELPHLEESARRFLDLVGYVADGADGSGSTAQIRQNRLAILAAAAKLKSIFRLPAPDAPGLCLVGGEAAPDTAATAATASLAGAGLSLEQAFNACVAEGIEYLSQFERSGDTLECGPPAASLAALGPDSLTFLADWMGAGSAEALDQVEWTPAIRLKDRTRAWMPADIVYRRATGQDAVRLALGCGCAAGVSWEAATLAALCEVVERDHVALWWRGGRPGKPLPVEALSDTGAASLLSKLRQGQAGRSTALIDISSELQIPCLAALSFTDGGNGFALGTAASPSRSSAVHSAIIEMCMMEAGHRIVELKLRQLGASALNEADRRQVARSRNLSPVLAGRCNAIVGLGGGVDFGRMSAADSLSALVDRLATGGFHAYAVDLTRGDFSVPVARVVVPGLQPFPSSYVSPRLAAVERAYGKAVDDSRNVDLF